jgi:MFS family permease
VKARFRRAVSGPLTGAATLRRAGFLTALLVGVDFLDEFSGVSTVGAPDIQGEYALSYGTVALIIFVIPQLIGLLLEPPLYVLGDRYPRKWFVLGGLTAMALCDLLAGLAWSFWVLVGALALTGAASGCGVNLAQATLMDTAPTEREKWMTRWTLMGMLGDLGTPLLFAALALLSLGWREAFLVTGGLILAYTAVLGTQRFPRPAHETREALPPVREVIGAALRNRRLLVWLFGVWLCGLLDEILVAFGALHLGHTLGADVATRSAVLACLMVGALVGLLATDRLLSRGMPPLRLLRFAGFSCALVYAAWVFAPDVWSSALLMAGVGACSAPLYPIAQAQAYRALPGQSGMVNAVSSIFGPLTIALPWALGLLADHLGLVVALLVLGLQPVGLLLIALRERD